MRVEETWDWLRTSPLLWLFVTVAAYESGRWLRSRTQHPLAQPTLVAIVVCSISIELLRVPYADYYSATSLITFLLGPATVALAVPLHRQYRRLKDFLLPMLTGLIVGAVVSVGRAFLSSSGLAAATSSRAPWRPRPPQHQSRSHWLTALEVFQSWQPCLRSSPASLVPSRVPVRCA